MARRDDLRRLRTGTVINLSSQKMESQLGKAMVLAVADIEKRFPGISLVHDSKVYLKDIVSHLSESFPDVPFTYNFDTSFLLPDGGILYAVDKSGKRHVVLISEAKRQGTNDLRAAEGLAKQSKGNAIERLGKNMAGFRSWLSTEGIMPFICFGEGVDFSHDSSILDRVSTIAMFGPLNEIQVLDPADAPTFSRGSFFFRVEWWSAEEMAPLLVDIASRSIYYYFAKLGQAEFVEVGD